MGFTQGKLHETRVLLWAIHESDGNPQQPHGTQRSAELSWGKHSSSLLCQQDGIGDASSAASPGHPAVTLPSPKGSMAQISIPQHSWGPHTLSPARNGHPRAALQTLWHPKHSMGSTWEPGLPRGRRSPVPSWSSAPEHDPPSQCTTPAAPFPKAQPFPKDPQDLSNQPPKTTSFFFPHPQALVSNSSNAKSHGAADFICIY